jgi:hypothetical protein
VGARLAAGLQEVTHYDVALVIEALGFKKVEHLIEIQPLGAKDLASLDVWTLSLSLGAMVAIAAVCPALGGLRNSNNRP